MVNIFKTTIAFDLLGATVLHNGTEATVTAVSGDEQYVCLGNFGAWFKLTSIDFEIITYRTFPVHVLTTLKRDGSVNAWVIITDLNLQPEYTLLPAVATFHVPIEAFENEYDEYWNVEWSDSEMEFVETLSEALIWLYDNFNMEILEEAA